MLSLKKKVLFGLAIGLALAMAIGSFALGETSTNDATVVTKGDFTISGDGIAENTDFVFNDSNGLLTIISEKEMKISTRQQTTQRIKVDLLTGSEAKLILDGVNINTDQGAAFEIKGNATFNVNITLADDSKNYLTSDDNFAGLDKSDDGSVGIDQLGKLTIKGTGQLTATGGAYGAGIGGGFHSAADVGYNGSNITIISGTIYATGFGGAAGIGGGVDRSGTNITISGGNITATGGYLEIDGKKVSGAGIGGGGGAGSGSNNKLSGNAVVLATSGADYFSTGVKPQLDGFADSDRTGGIVFTGVGTYEDDGTGTWVLKSTDWIEGIQYGNVTITGDTTFPANFKITSNAALTIGKNVEGKEATLSMAEGKELIVEGSLINEGVIDIPAENIKGNGKITTLLNYDPQGGEIVTTNDDNHITYQDAGSIKKYESLPEATKEGYELEGWHTEKTGKEGTKVKPTDNVLLNQHTLYANWVEPAPPTPTPPGPEPQPTPPGPEPGPTPEPTPDPSVDPDGDGGDGGSSAKTSDPFMGGMALALLGVATTGAVLVHKRK